jgi:hypothetical protein
MTLSFFSFNLLLLNAFISIVSLFVCIITDQEDSTISCFFYGMIDCDLIIYCVSCNKSICFNLYCWSNFKITQVAVAQVWKDS